MLQEDMTTSTDSPWDVQFISLLGAESTGEDGPPQWLVHQGFISQLDYLISLFLAGDESSRTLGLRLCFADYQNMFRS
jgi:hypothetical protein